MYKPQTFPGAYDKYTILKGVLYGKRFSHPLLQCLLPSKVESVMREIYEGICGDYLGGKLLAQKIFKKGTTGL